jgi:hypothetical protein
MRSLLVFLSVLPLVGCGGTFGESSIPAGDYSGVFAELTTNTWRDAPANFMGTKLTIDVSIGSDGFPVINGQKIETGMVIDVTMGDIELSEKILQITGQGTRVNVAYSGTVKHNGVTSSMSGGYIITGGTSDGWLTYQETIYVGTTIPDETRATSIIDFEGTLRP